jgi:hypothetical protein
MSLITRPDASEYDLRYHKYMELVPEADLLQAMTGQLEETRQLLRNVPEVDIRFAPGEWTAREILGHILDTERIFGYRLLCYSRGDAIKLEPADQDLYVKYAEFERYPFEEILQEFRLVRQSHLSLLRYLPPEAWERTGMVGGLSISVRAIAYLMLGHERHHLITIQTHYLAAQL